MKRLIVSVLMLMAATLIFSQRSADKESSETDFNAIPLEQIQSR